MAEGRPFAPPKIDQVLDALKRSGMRETNCTECGRWFMTRDPVRDDGCDLCPPCSGEVPGVQ